VLPEPGVAAGPAWAFAGEAGPLDSFDPDLFDRLFS